MTQSEFAKIYQIYFHNVYLYLLKLCKDEHLAEELASETFFKAMKAIDKFRGHCDINTWLITIAKNSYFSYLKRNKSVVGLDQIVEVRDDKVDIENQIIKKDSNLLINEHLKECSKCSAYEQSLKEEIIRTTGNMETIPLKKLQVDIFKRKQNSIIFISLIVGLFMLTSFFYMTKPHFVTEKDSGVSIETLNKDNIYINFSENITSSKLRIEKWEGGQNVAIVEAWTSIWDNILGKSTPSLSIKNVGETVDTIYYFSNMEENAPGNMTIIYGENPNPNGGVVTLPRLVTGAYFHLAILLSIVMGVMCLIFRNKKKVSVICNYLFLMPMSYIAGQVLLGVGFTSFTAQRDFVMMIIAATMIYGICIFGLRLLVQHKQDQELEFDAEDK